MRDATEWPFSMVDSCPPNPLKELSHNPETVPKFEFGVQVRICNLLNISGFSFGGT